MKPVACLAMAIGLCSTGFGQMEKRWSDRYDGVAFAAASPAVGALAPDLLLPDLNGRTWSLHEQLGKTVVLIKAAYT